jgi:beta-glucosidase
MADPVHRRKFLKTLALTGSVAASANLLAACSGTNEATTPPGNGATPTGPVTGATSPGQLPALTATNSPITAVVPPIGPTTAAATATVPATTGLTPVTNPGASVLQKFPQDFLWGTATSAYQVEGAVKEDGRGESIWDRFSHSWGNIKDFSNGDIANDHYHLYEQDLNLMQELGFQTYRFSIAWPRIFPSGSGQLNQKGLDFYRKLVDGLHKRNIRPMTTLYHWDLPQALQDQGGWANRDTASRFAEYAATVYRALGDGVTDWITHNEPWVVAFVGNAFGTHAPGLKDWGKALQVSHNLLLSHGLATQAYRATNSKNGQIGLTLNLAPMYPVSDKPADKAAAYRYDGFQNRWFLDPVFKGAYPADMLPYYEKKYGSLSYIKPEDLKIINAPIDFLGINYYSPSRIVSQPSSGYFELGTSPGPNPVTAMDWEIAPDSLYDLLVRLKQDYGNIPLYITENGAAFDDKIGTNGEIDDARRLHFLYLHFAAARRAIEAGVNLKGYFVWSLMDNFEWAEGYSKRFGIIYVDYPTEKRTPKRSALWYRDVIRRNGLGELPADLQTNGLKFPATPTPGK